MSKTIPDIYVIIHGPLTGNAYHEIFESLLPAANQIKRVIVSSYCGSEAKIREVISDYYNAFNVKEVYIKDTINPGYFNLNRQILTVRAALDTILDESAFVIKLRNDQWCNIKKLLYYLEKRSFLQKDGEKILTTNCYTRMDRLYHPSDMFLCGSNKTLKEYYSMPLQRETHLNVQLDMLKKLKYTTQPFAEFLVSPESELFKNYLHLKHWELKYTVQDSYQALKTYVDLINTWDIDLRWNKQRNAFLSAKTVILPYSFTQAPFAGAPTEKAKCYARHQFEGKETLRDRAFIFYSRLVFSIQYNRIHRLLLKIKHHTPACLKDFLGHTRLGHLLKGVADG